MKKFFAFTLAEVLITLGIIGVVAALTIPSLISNHRKNVFVNQLKKTVSTVNNGVKLMLADTGTDDMRNTNFYNYIYDIQSAGQSQLPSIFNTEFRKYFNLAKNPELVKSKARSYKVEVVNGQTLNRQYPDFGNIDCVLLTFTDGSEVCLYESDMFDTDDVATFPALSGIVDVNGHNRLPNTAGLDVFEFSMRADGGMLYQFQGRNACRTAHVSAVYDCFTQVVQDGWEITYY